MTSLFSYSPDDLEELQFLFLNYVNQDFPECTCGCRGFPINILTLEFNEIENSEVLQCIGLDYGAPTRTLVP